MTENKWDLSHLYESVDAVEKAKLEFLPKADSLKAYVGRLGESAQTLREALDLRWNLELLLRRMETYTARYSDEDTRDSKANALNSEIELIRTQFTELCSFFEPEIVAIAEKDIVRYIEEDKGLNIYQRPIREIFRMKKHVLSLPEEKILASAMDIAETGHSTFRIFSNADLPRETVTLSDGQEVKLTDANYAKHRRSSVKSDRDIVSETFIRQYGTFKRSIGEMLYGQMKTHLFYAKMRGYSDTLTAALDNDDIDTAIYHTLVETVQKNLPTFHRYLKLKARALGVKSIEYQDLYVPFTQDKKIEVPFEQTPSMLKKALAPLGDEYPGLLDTAFTEGWIDVFPGEGKRSGAYSSGWAYDVHPYVLMNYNNEYSDALTLAHELGHAMHSHYSNANQPIATSDYSIFVAEVASTFNENLLNDYMLKNVESDEQRFYLLGNFLDASFKGTFTRQAQFAEFELLAHQCVENGEALTGDSLSKMYIALLRKYYGHDEGACRVPDYFDTEWAYVPHFYYNYYVFQYATSIAAASSLATKVVNKEAGALERYFSLLKAGDSSDPVSTLKNAGVDMTQPVAYEAFIHRANRYMDEMENILEKQG